MAVRLIQTKFWFMCIFLSSDTNERLTQINSIVIKACKSVGDEVCILLQLVEIISRLLDLKCLTDDGVK